MVKRSKCKISNSVVVKTGLIQPKRYLKVRSLKDLKEPMEIKAEKKNPEDIGNNSSERTGVEENTMRKRQLKSDVAESESKKIKVEVKTEFPDGSENSSAQEGSSNGKLSSVQILGNELWYKQSGSRIFFKTCFIMDMLSKHLPLTNPCLKNNTSDRLEDPSSPFNDDTWKRAFISWNALRLILNGGLIDLAIREILLSVRSVGENYEIKEQGARYKCIQDSLIIDEIEVKFKVRTNVVYLDVLSAFTCLGKLHEAMNGTWTRVDQVLASNGLTQKAAFKKRGIGRNRNGDLTRNYMTLEAFCILSKGHKIHNRVQNLTNIVTNLKEKGQNISREIQQTVDMILRTSCIVPSYKTASSLERKVGHKHCENELCSRGYHFVLRCCSKNHVLVIGGQDIGFVRKGEKVFLEKCAAFGALGKMFVIRCSDYRKTDKILMEKDNCVSVENHFLFENDDPKLGRNRRTHISLDSFLYLVQAGFVDPCKKQSLLECIDQVRSDYQENLLDTCEDMEIIDLSSSDVEDLGHKSAEESSSGIESDFSAATASSSCQQDIIESESDMEMDLLDAVQMFGEQIKIKTIGNNIYLEINSILRVLEYPDILQKEHRLIEKLLLENNVCMDEAFLYDGRQKSFISTLVLKLILTSEPLKCFEKASELLLEVTNLENNPEIRQDCQFLSLQNFDKIRFISRDGTVHIETQKLLQLAGYNSSLLQPEISKANILLCKILSDRGVNIHDCFMKHGKSRYAFLSLSAVRAFLGSDKSENVSMLLHDILNALKDLGLIKSITGDLEDGIKVSPEFPAIKYKIENDNLYLHRKSCFEFLGLEATILSSKKGYNAINNILILGGLNPMDCFLTSKQQRYCFISCVALIHLLQSKDPLMVCLPNKEQLLAGLLKSLQMGAIRTFETETGSRGTMNVQEEIVEYQGRDGQIFFRRHTVYKLAGLYDQVDWLEQESDTYNDPTCILQDRGVNLDSAFIEESSDKFAWISLQSLLILMVYGLRTGEVTDSSYHTVAWRDLLSAVSLQEPRLKNFIKMENFKTQLLKKIVALFVLSIEEKVDRATQQRPLKVTNEKDDQMSENERSMEVIQEKVKRTNSNLKNPTHTALPEDLLVPPRISIDQEVPNSAPVSPFISSSIPSPSNSVVGSPSSSCLPSPTGSLSDETWINLQSKFSMLTQTRYEKMKEDILKAANGVGGRIGDWEVVKAGKDITVLDVRPGYGASRKGSFLHPDFAAILRYSLSLAPGECRLTINEHEISIDVLKTIFERAEKEGTLSFLYQIISLRPCFGSFSPELVETVSRSLDKKENSSKLLDVYIDANFIGTSSTGRTYAGTVRSMNCDFLAGDRVSDSCNSCKQLDKVTINRSILGDDEYDIKGSAVSSEEPVNKSLQKSVWQLATTSSEGCSFLCPQVQSFNTSLPHAFDGSVQATSIISHRVEIKNNLEVNVELCEKPVTRTFPEFQKNRQLGPLLDWVAGLRYCVGYPNMTLVKQATFILENMERVKPQLRKFFKFLVVDDKFTYQNDNDEESGTIRAGSCRVTAEPGADICQQCRLLQEPLEFMTL